MLALIDPSSGDIAREIALAGLDDALNPSFSPDGQSIVFSGNQGGLIDLYLLDVETGALDRLTHDPFADLEPTFTPDGRSLVFVTERFSTDLATLQAGPLRLARLDLATRDVRPISGFLSGKHLSPQVSADGRTLTFIAEPDGVSNLYRMPIDGGPIVRLSSFPTGVAGITASSPALSLSPSTGRLRVQRVRGRRPRDLCARRDGRREPRAAGRGDRGPRCCRDETPPHRRRRRRGARLLADSESRACRRPARRRRACRTSRSSRSTSSGSRPSQPASGSSAGSSAAVSRRSSATCSAIGCSDSARRSAARSPIFGGAGAVYINRKHRWNWAASAEQTPYASAF